jgi:hypothetical protein
MPLIECPDCKKQVSDTARACIHCGRRRPIDVKFFIAGLAMSLAVVLLTAAYLPQ